MKPAVIGDGVEVRESTLRKAGRGLFASRWFDEGELITEYGGTLISWTEGKKRRNDQKDSHIRAVDSQHTAIDGIGVSVIPGNAGASFANDPHCGDRSIKPSLWNAEFVRLEPRQQVGPPTLSSSRFCHPRIVSF